MIEKTTTAKPPQGQADTAATIAANRVRYAIDHWADGYFRIDEAGRVVACPAGKSSQAIVLAEVVSQAWQQGLKTPLFIRFTDILRHRRDSLIAAFNRAMDDHDYPAAYQLVYPIKVNQHRQVVQGLLHGSTDQFGLEAGSKPELMIALAHGQGKTVICNGYKDRSFIRLALIGRAMGVNSIIVVEKPRDLTLVLEEAENLGIEPVLGVRMRLSTLASGQWQNSGGQKAKFGLVPGQLLAVLERLQQAGKGHWLKLLHFHMGSQVANLEDITQAVAEIGRYYTEICARGFCPDTLDIGGGLAVDYEGARSRDAFSMNYDMDEYAQAVVATVADTCRLHQVPPPHIISESGRALTAHHSVLIADITDSEDLLQEPVTEPSDWHELCQAAAALADRQDIPASERYFRARALHEKGLRAFAEGQMDLANRAWLDFRVLDLYRQLLPALLPSHPLQAEIRQHIEELLAQKYFANFSVFESVPDVWGIDQVFPVMPLHRLHQPPDRNAVIHDLTCDSDGRIKRYVSTGHPQTWLPLHAPDAGYLIGIFLTGAYQEILGDIHNLFGDTHSVVVEAAQNNPGQWTMTETRQGDTTDQLLDYVGYNVAAIEERLNRWLAESPLAAEQQARMRHRIHQELHGYTYLDHTP
jgi:arginine decarboxylase